MRYFFLTIQFICCISLFNQSIYLIKHWKSMLYSYLLLSCITGFLNTLGYLAALYTETIDSYITAIQLSYAGRVWYAFTLLLFTAELCKKTIPTIIKTIIMLFNTITYGFIITTRRNNLYYTITGFSTDGLFPRLIRQNSQWHNLFMVVQAIYMIVIFIWLFSELHKTNNRLVKKKFLFVILSMISQSIFFIIEMIGIKGLKGYYDVTMIGCLIGTLFQYIAILRYDLMNTRELAEKFMIDRLSEGIIAVDNEGVIQYFNKPAQDLFPELKIGDKKIPQKVITMLEDGKKIKEKLNRETITIEERYFLAEENELIQGGKNFGKVYTLIDETEHIRYLKEKEETRIQQLEIENYKNQVRLSNETIFSIANAVEARDKRTGRHSFRVAQYAVLIAEELGFNEEEKEQLRKTGLLHDIGKIGVPDAILNKPTTLTEEEYEIMKTHALIGSEILKDFTSIPHVDEGAKYHHERYDGSGYPMGLKGEDIPFNARIIGIADAFDAMTTNRIYRKGLDINLVKDELQKWSGSQFDPKLVSILIRLIENGKINPEKMLQENG